MMAMKPEKVEECYKEKQNRKGNTMLMKSRKMAYDNRVALQQADQAIRKDITRALVELVTNSNDSYQRMEDEGQDVSGLIILEIQRRHTNSIVRVRDHAQGMDSNKMDETVGTYGGATSGFEKGKSVRGLWGRGLKDSIFGLGHGHVYSIFDDTFHHGSLLINRGEPTFQLENPIKARKAIRKQWETTQGNSTIVEIVVSRSDIRIPQFDNIRRYLERHFELRPILSNPKRKVSLRELDSRNKPKEDTPLNYVPPVGKSILSEIVHLPENQSRAHLSVFRSDIPLSTPAEEGPLADGGFSIISKHVVLDLTLFKFEHNEYASHFFGSVVCDGLNELLKKIPPEPILSATRDGINWDHKFTRELKKVIESKIEPLIDEEKKRARAEQQDLMNKQLRQRLNVVLKELNSIAKLELGNVGDGVGTSDGLKTPYVPPNGFGFVPDYVYIQTGKPASLTLRGTIPEKLSHGALVTIESDNSEVNILSSQVMMEQMEDYPNIGEAHVHIEGRQVGAESIVTARIGSEKAEALVKVISKKIVNPEPVDPRHRGALIKDFRFDPNAEPRQRVRFDKSTSSVIISTKAPSVATYLDESGNGHETPQGQVLLAELIAEAACREMARRGVETGKFLVIEGSEADAIQREYINLQNKYAHHIHKCLVDSIYRRNAESQMRKGRPKREDSLRKAVIEA